MGTFAGEQRPGAALAPSFVWAAVFSLAVAVVVVAPPDGSAGRFDLEDGVDDLEAIYDERVIGAPDAIADELQKGPHPRFRALGSRPVHPERGWRCGCNRERRWRRRRARLRPAAGCGCSAAGRRAGEFRPLGRGPAVKVGFDPVGEGFKVAGRCVLTVASRKVSSADEGGDDGCEGGRGVAGVLFPALLLGDRGVAGQGRRRPAPRTGGHRSRRGRPPSRERQASMNGGRRPRRAGCRPSRLCRRSRSSGRIRRPPAGCRRGRRAREGLVSARPQAIMAVADCTMSRVQTR